MEFEGGKYDILNGFEHVLLAGLAFGCQGSIGITFSLVGPHYAKISFLLFLMSVLSFEFDYIFKSFQENDVATARKEHQIGVQFYSVLNRYGLIRAHKAVLKLKGLGIYNNIIDTNIIIILLLEEPNSSRGEYGKIFAPKFK